MDGVSLCSPQNVLFKSVTWPGSLTYLFHVAHSVEGCIIVIAACVPMLYPVCNAIFSRLRGANKHGNASSPGCELESPSKLNRGKPGFWTRKLQLALDVERYGASDSTTGPDGSAREYSTHDAGVDLAQGMPRGEKGTGSYNSGDHRSAEVVTIELARELSDHYPS